MLVSCNKLLLLLLEAVQQPKDSCGSCGVQQGVMAEPS